MSVSSFSRVNFSFSRVNFSFSRVNSSRTSRVRVEPVSMFEGHSPCGRPSRSPRGASGRCPLARWRRHAAGRPARTLARAPPPRTPRRGASGPRPGAPAGPPCRPRAPAQAEV
eukprot:1188381-Prorocentrum_minimum.AAC.5